LQVGTRCSLDLTPPKTPKSCPSRQMKVNAKHFQGTPSGDFKVSPDAVPFSLFSEAQIHTVIQQLW
jgi:hypothetical protein